LVDDDLVGSHAGRKKRPSARAQADGRHHRIRRGFLSQTNRVDEIRQDARRTVGDLQGLDTDTVLDEDTPTPQFEGLRRFKTAQLQIRVCELPAPLKRCVELFGSDDLVEFRRQQDVGAARLLDPLAQPGQRHKDVRRSGLIGPEVETSEGRIARNRLHPQTKRGGSVRIGRQRDIARHQAGLLDAKHHLVADRDAQLLGHRFADNERISLVGVYGNRGMANLVESVVDAEDLHTIDSTRAIVVGDDSRNL